MLRHQLFEQDIDQVCHSAIECNSSNSSTICRVMSYMFDLAIEGIKQVSDIILEYQLMC